jgi:hypothetical protein
MVRSYAIASQQCLNLFQVQPSIRAFHSIYFASPSCSSHGNFFGNTLQNFDQVDEGLSTWLTLPKEKYPRLACAGPFYQSLLENLLEYPLLILQEAPAI